MLVGQIYGIATQDASEAQPGGGLTKSLRAHSGLGTAPTEFKILPLNLEVKICSTSGGLQLGSTRTNSLDTNMIYLCPLYYTALPLS